VRQADSKLICVVDDDGDVRDSMSALLESFGYAVMTFTSAAEFLEGSHPVEAACLIVDFQMPGMTRIELLEVLAARNDDIPAIIVTANEPRRIAQVLRSNVLKVLKKPVTGEELIHWVEKACARGTPSR
jgi:FixJ family two-component response regulator